MIPQLLRRLLSRLKKQNASSKVSAEKPTPKFHTTYPDNPMKEEEWLTAFNRYYRTGKN